MPHAVTERVGDLSAASAVIRGYSPAIDGLRALAISSVLAYHHDARLIPGGFLGVSLFFTLSGFLISARMLGDTDAVRRPKVKDFWIRRARRIVPVAWGGLILAMVVSLATVPVFRRPEAFGDVRAALLSVANWRFIVADAGYGEAAVSPVLHYWSLAIEEQFYLVLPILLVLTRTRRTIAIVALVGAAASVSQQVLIQDFDRIYYGTDTRAAELLAGVVAGASLPWLARRMESRSRTMTAAGFVALAGTLGLFLMVPLDAVIWARGGLGLASLLWLGLVLGAIFGRRFAWMLSRAPLPYMGRLSFAIYVVHYPIFLWLDAARVGLDGSALLLVRLVAALTMAAALHVLIEQPIRVRHALSGLRAPVAAATAGTVIVAGTLVLGARAQGSDEPAVFYSAPPATAPVSARDKVVNASPGITVQTVPSVSTTARSEAPITPSTAATVPTTSDRIRPTRLLVVGDSTARTNGLALQEVGAHAGDLEVWVVSGPACALHRGERLLLRNGWVYDPPCDDFAQLVIDQAEEIEPDAIVVFIGSPQIGLWDYGSVVQEFTGLDDPTVALGYERALGHTLDRFEALRIPVLWADVPQPQWDIDEHARRSGRPAPGSGPSTFNNAERWLILKTIDSTVIATRPNVSHWQYADTLSPAEQVPTSVRPDGLHLDGAVAIDLAASSWLPMLRSEYVRLTAPSRRASDPHTWAAPNNR